MINILLLSLVFLAASCSNMPLDEKKRNDIDQIAFVSVVPDSMEVKHVGTTIFQNTDAKADIAGWKLNETFQAELESQLKSQGKTFKSVKFDHEEIKSILGKKSKFNDNSQEELRKYVSKTAKTQGAKYVFLVQTSSNSSTPFPEGVGLYCRAAFGLKGDWIGTYQVHVGLLDVETSHNVYQTAVHAGDFMHKSGKACNELKSGEVKKFSEQFKGELQSLARKSAVHILQKSHLIPGQPKSSFEL